MLWFKSTKNRLRKELRRPYPFTSLRNQCSSLRTDTRNEEQHVILQQEGTHYFPQVNANKNCTDSDCSLFRYTVNDGFKKNYYSQKKSQ